MSTDTVSQTTRPIGSQVLHLADRYAGRTQVAVAVVIADVFWVLFSTVVGVSDSTRNDLQTMVAALTLAMVFVIQHTQAREQVATQRKLDEILRAIPYADNALIAMEDADDDTLADTRRAHRNLRREAIDDPCLIQLTSFELHLTRT